MPLVASTVISKARSKVVANFICEMGTCDLEPPERSSRARSPTRAFGKAFGVGGASEACAAGVRARHARSAVLSRRCLALAETSPVRGRSDLLGPEAVKLHQPGSRPSRLAPVNRWLAILVNRISSCFKVFGKTKRVDSHVISGIRYPGPGRVAFSSAHPGLGSHCSAMLTSCGMQTRR